MKRIPNVDGKYQSKDRSITVTVTRKEIAFDFKQPDKPKLIEDDEDYIDEDTEPRYRRNTSRPKHDANAKMNKVMDVIDRTSEILIGRGR